MKQTAKEKQIIEAINRLLPNVEISELRSGNEDAVNYSVYFIPPENYCLSKSEYSFNGKLNFIHFTSLFAIQSIICERNIRLYNINNLNDPREYAFAGNLITFNNENKIDARDNFYLLSMCQPELLLKSIDIEFNIWRLYGDNGKGVAVEFNFDESSPVDWKHYFLSKVHYGTSQRKKLQEISKLLKELDDLKPKVIVDLGQIACFHKSRLFELEREIRFLFDNRSKRLVQTKYTSNEGEYLSPIIRTDISKSSLLNKEVKYLELPIYHKDFKPVFDKNPIPVPKIKRIIFGYSYNDNFKKLSAHLSDLCNDRLGYIPKIVQSRLTKYYYDRG